MSEPLSEEDDGPPSRGDGTLEELSPAKQALAARRLAVESHPTATAATRHPTTGPRPLSLAQEQLWYFSRLAPDNPVYNEAVTIRKDGSFVFEAFHKAFNELLRRHDAWRTTFAVVDGQPVQMVQEPEWMDIPVQDLEALPRADAEAEAGRLAAEVAARPYDLAAGPLVRPMLVRFSEDHHRLYLALHHLVFDGVSLYRIVLPELVSLYDAYAAGVEPDLPDPPCGYADYAEWEREWMERGPAAGRLEHWRRRLEAAPALELPLDRPRPSSQHFRGVMVPIVLPAATGERLAEVAGSLRATVFQVVAAAYAALLQRYCGQDEIVFGVGADLRQRPELQPLVGYCLTPLVVRCRVDPTDTFSQLTARIRAEVIDALSNLVPFGAVVRAVQPERHLSSNPLFQAMLTMEPEMATPDPAWSLHQMETSVGNAVGHAKFDLTLELDHRPRGHYDGRLILNSDVFDQSTADRIARHFSNLLVASLARPGDAICDLPMMEAEEVQRQLVAWNATAAPEPAEPVHALVAAQATRTPDAVAVELGDRSLSYRGLQSAVCATACWLREAGALPGDVVGIYSERSLEIPVGLLGILQAGAAYLPLDPALPSSRLAFMVRDAGAGLLLVPERLAHSAGFRALVADLAPNGPAVVTLPPPDAPLAGNLPPDALAPAGDGLSERSPSGGTLDGPAYVMYTSGSSGTPKGVLVRHSALSNVLSSLAREPGMGTDDVVLAVTGCGFDIAAVELLMPLTVGARVVMAPDEAVADGGRLAAMIDATRATFVQATPTTWRLIVDSGWKGNPRLVAVSGGEAISQHLAEAILRRCGELWNAYGPTETTIWSTLAQLRAEDAVSIGRPIANTRVYVLDGRDEPVPVGVAGELAIAGAGVAAGYLNRPAETATAFVADPFSPGKTMYKTGDRGRFLADGRIQYLGRSDSQVKLRGHRIELKEIETHLDSLPSIQTSAVAMTGDGTPGGTRLEAFVVADGAMPTERSLRDQLRSSLPDYMVPARFHEVPELPRNANGKLDRSALRHLGRDVAADQAAAVTGTTAATSDDRAPRTPLEQLLLGMWGDMLGSGPLAVEDDFFDLGGHSLLAVLLVNAVAERLSLDLPLSVMYERGSTVRGMASCIEAVERGDPTGAAGGLVGRPPLFFVVPSEPTLIALRHLVPAVAPRRTVLGLLAGRLGEPFDRTRSIEERAAAMIESVLAVQAAGPYYVGGFSLGGVIAYEIAAQLRKGGHEVAWLGLVNTRCPLTATRRSSPVAKLARSLSLGPASTAASMRRWLGRVIRPAARVTHATPGNEFDGPGALAIGARYVPRSIGVTLDLFVSERDAISHGRTLGWRHADIGPIRLHPIPGDHPMLFDPRNAAALARELAASLSPEP